MNIFNCRFLRPTGINAIVIYPFVLYCEADPLEKIIKHENVHLHQIKRDGVGTFYKRYLMEYFKNRFSGMDHDQAYRNISYEREAYRVSS